MSNMFEDDFSEDDPSKKKVEKIILNFNIENTLVLYQQADLSKKDHVIY